MKGLVYRGEINNTNYIRMEVNSLQELPDVHSLDVSKWEYFYVEWDTQFNMS